MRIRRRPALAAAVAVLVVAAVVIGVLLTRPTGHGTGPVAATVAPTPSPTASRQPVLTPVTSSASPAAAAAVTARLAHAALSPELGRELSGIVVDAATGDVLWSHDPTRAGTPASTTKLLTATAVLSGLGPDWRARTEVRRTGSTLVLVGGGDVTMTRTPLAGYPRFSALSTLAHRTAAALTVAGVSRSASLRLDYDDSAWSGPQMAVGWHHDYVSGGDITPPSPLELDEGRVDGGSGYTPRVTDPAQQAAVAFAGMLRADGIDIDGRPRQTATTAGSSALADLDSPPLSQLVQHMLTVSDDDLAEALGRELALHDHLPASFTGAASAVLDGLHRLDIPTTGVVLDDTSGLSYGDRIPPQVLSDVLRVDVSSTAHPALAAIPEGLPVAGLTGTLAARYRSGSAAAAAGILRAKTGTLDNVDTIAGFVTDRSGRLLVFALLADKTASPYLAEAGLDRLAGRLAGCGCG